MTGIELALARAKAMTLAHTCQGDVHAAHPYGIGNAIVAILATPTTADRVGIKHQPQGADNAAPAGAAVGARKWSRGELMCGQAFAAADGYTLTGTLVSRPGVELAVAASGTSGPGSAPGTFVATGTGTSGPLKGMVSELTGRVFPELPFSSEAAARVLSIRGSIRTVRGTDAKPGEDPSGMPLGTVGAFVISQTVA